MRYFSIIYLNGTMEEVEFNEIPPIMLEFNRCLTECLGENYYIKKIKHELFKDRIYIEESEEINVQASNLLGVAIKGRVLVEYM